MAQATAKKERYWTLTLACLAGPTLWALHFGMIYGTAHFACQLRTPAVAEGLMNWLVAAGTVIIGALLAVLLLPGWYQRLTANAVIDADNLKFLEYTARGLALLSLFGVIWAGLSVLFIPACATQ